MKKIYSVLMLAVAAMATFSCAKEIEVNLEPEKAFEPKVITAYTDDDVMPTTKTSLSGVSVLWAATDKIKGVNDEGTIYTSTSTSVSGNNKKADFTFSNVTVEEDLLFLAYPAENVSNIDEDFVYATLPSSQPATANSFANLSNVAIAEGLDANPVFKNVGGLISFTINNDDITSVTISANENLTGAAKISVAGASFAQATITSGKNYVTVSGSIVNGSTYYAVVYPGEYTGLTIEVSNSTGKVAKYTNPNTLTVERNGNLHIATLTIPAGKWQDIEKGAEYVMTPATNCWTNWATYTQNGVSWTPVLVSGTGTPGSYTAGKGYQFGTGSNGVEELNLTGIGYKEKSKAVSGNIKAFGIKDIIVSLAAKAGNTYTVSAKVGGVAVEGSKDAAGNGNNTVQVTFHSDICLDGDVVINYKFKSGTPGYVCVNTITINKDNRANAELAYGTSSVTKVFGEANFTNTLTNSHSLAITYKSSNTGVATVNSSTGEVTITGVGETDITATFAGDEDYKNDQVSYTLTVNKATPTIADFVSPTTNVAVGSSVTNTTTISNGLAITYTTSDSSIASVNASTGEVTGVDDGIAIISATFTGNANFNAATAKTYTITVGEGGALPLDAPANVKITKLSASSFTATWNAPSDPGAPAGYSWKLSTSSNPADAAITGGSGSINDKDAVTLTVDSGITLSEGTTYYFHILSSETAGYSASSYSSSPSTSFESVTFADQGYGNNSAVSTYSGSVFSITFNKGDGSNNPTYYTTGDAIRIYAKSNFTVSSTSNTIKCIDLGFGSGDGSNEITTDKGTYTSGTWTGSESSVTFTMGGTKGHRRIASVCVTYSN